MANDEPAHSAPPPPPPPVQWIPEPWAQRAAGGALVWSATPVIGPMPNFGNGFAAAEFPTDATSAQMYIAGVFEGGLPPPFGKEMGGVSARAAVPLPLTQVRNGTGWHAVALANDFERATVELLLLRQAGDNEHDDAATPAAVVTRHYFHRESMHLLVAEVAVNNSAGAEPLELEVATLWPSGASRASSFKATSAGAGGPSCQIGTTTESERVMSGATAGTGMENVTVVVCYPRSGLTLRAAPGATAHASTVVTVYTSRESAAPLQDAIALWRNHTAAATALQASHYAAQTRLWSSRIEIEGDLELAATVNSSLYGILISVREGLNYSTSPGGLPNGCYNGHTFWDVEQFIWPNLLLLYPSMARAAMQYRFDTMGAARENAKTLCDTNCTGSCQIEPLSGRMHCSGWPCSQPHEHVSAADTADVSGAECKVRGLKYAWESATTGAKNAPFGAIYLHKNDRSFYQDRLGTDIGNVEKKSGVFRRLCGLPRLLHRQRARGDSHLR